MDILCFRIMARKSLFTGGRYENILVQEVINLENHTYLSYSYFNYDKVSFLPDILKELKITGDFIINKPGKSPKLYKKWKNHFYNNMTPLEHIIKYKKVKKRRKIKAKSKEIASSMSKIQLKRKQYKKSLTFTGKIK